MQGMKILGRKTIKNDKTSAPMVKATKASKASQAKAAPTHEEIAARAFELYLARGNEPGNHETDWLKAEAELSAR
jgi:hypothetical protein